MKFSIFFAFLFGLPANVFQYCVTEKLQLLVIEEPLCLVHFRAVHLDGLEQVLHAFGGPEAIRQKLRVLQATVGEGIADMILHDYEVSGSGGWVSEGKVQEGGVAETVAQPLLEGLEGVVQQDVLGDDTEQKGVLHLE